MTTGMTTRAWRHSWLHSEREHSNRWSTPPSATTHRDVFRCGRRAPLQTTLNDKKEAMIHERVMELLTTVQPPGLLHPHALEDLCFFMKQDAWFSDRGVLDPRARRAGDADRPPLT